MAIGTIGVVRPSDVNINDIDMYYNFTPNRHTNNNNFIKLNSNEYLEYCYLPSDNQITPNGENLMEGLYNLKLPSSVFNQIGIYTIYLKPKIITTTIVDCSVLSALPTVPGIIININDLDGSLRTNNSLQGFRLEYINSNGTKLRNVVRYVVTSNKVSVTTENVGNNSQKAQRYRFDELGTLLFLQITPSSASELKPNSVPYIGMVGQQILLSNTYFSPLVVEIELVENDIQSLTEYVVGEQIKDVQRGILSYYDKDRLIKKQFDLFTIKDDVTDVPLFEVKEERETIDTSQDFNEVIDAID